MRPLSILLTVLSTVTAICLAVYFWPMSEADVPTYIKVTGRLSEPHVSAFSPGPGSVVTIAVHNSHPWRSSPSRLWVACTVGGTVADVGTYGDVLVAFEAEGVHTVDGDGAEQIVPADSTAALDFNTKAGLPNHDLRAGDRLQNYCVAGATMKQALALAGYRKDRDQQGQWTALTPEAQRKYDIHTGW